MKKYIKAKELLETKANRKEKKPIYATRKLSIGLVSCMLGLAMAAPVVNAEEADPNQPQPVQEESQPADEGVDGSETNDTPVPLKEDETPKENLGGLETRGAGELEFSTENTLQPVRQASLEKLTVDTVTTGSTEIKGKNLKREKVSGKLVVAKLHLQLISENGDVKFEYHETPRRGGNWKVTLTGGVKVEAGDKIIAWQEYNGVVSEKTEVEAEKGLSSQYEGKLIMPTLEVWSEDMDVMSADAVEDITNAFIEANQALLAKNNKTFKENLYVPKNASDQTKAISVAGNGKSLTVTFSDGSKIENFDISDKVTITDVTETSGAAEIDHLTVIDDKISGKISGGTGEKDQFKGATVKIVKYNGETPKDVCTVDKNSTVLATLAVNPDTGEFSYNIDNSNLILGKDIGIIVKEKNKFNNCDVIKPVLAIPEVGVRDPKKLTETEKEAIKAAIREKNTVNGNSKLPDGTGYNKDQKAEITIADDGTITITGTSSNPVTTTMEVKQIVKNLPPNPPEVKISDDKKNINIAPNSKDTDAMKITVNYEDPQGNKKEAIAVKKVDDSGEEPKITWEVEKGDITVNNKGEVTLSKDKVKRGTEVSAIVTDNGGLTEDQTALDSDPTNLKILTKAEEINELGGLDPVVMKKWVGDKLDWKDGVKAKNDAKKDEVAELLNGATFEDVTETKRSTDKSGDFEGKVKVKFDDNSEIIVEKQMLYVSDLVNPSNKENLPEDALNVELKLGEGVKAGDKTGNKENPVSAKTYKVKPGTDLSKEKVSGTQNTCFDNVGATVTDDTYVDIVWNDKDKGTNFKASADNNVFTATATKKFKVTVQPNGGTGDDKVEFKKKDDTFKLPAANTFTPPNENQEFAGWLVGDSTTLEKPDKEIKITDNTVIKASWKPIEFTVKFLAGEGASGTMTDQTVKKGDDFTIPKPTFTAPKDKEFAGWIISGKEGVHQPDGKITISGDLTLTATWKDKPKQDDSTPGEGTTPDGPSTPSQPGGSTGTTPGTDENTTPDSGTKPGEKTPDKEEPKEKDPNKDKPGEPGKDNPTNPSKPGDEKPNQPGIKVPSRDDKKTPGKPEEGDKIVKKGDTEIVVPKEALTNENGKIKTEDKPKIVDKFKEKNPDVVDVKIHDNGNIGLVFKDGTSAELSSKDLLRERRIKIPKKHDELGAAKRAGKNVKTGIESAAGVVCTLVASTGALYIGRKKED